jgi:hypothetical protein
MLLANMTLSIRFNYDMHRDEIVDEAMSCQHYICHEIMGRYSYLNIIHYVILPA